MTRWTLIAPALLALSLLGCPAPKDGSAEPAPASAPAATEEAPATTEGAPATPEEGAAATETTTEAATPTASAQASTKDPVCNMDVDPATAKVSHEHDGVTYFFCGEHCKEAFVKEPAKYLNE